MKNFVLSVYFPFQKLIILLENGKQISGTCQPPLVEPLAAYTSISVSPAQAGTLLIESVVLMVIGSIAFVEGENSKVFCLQGHDTRKLVSNRICLWSIAHKALHRFSPRQSSSPAFLQPRRVLFWVLECPVGMVRI